MATLRELQWEELDLLQGLETVPVENEHGGVECCVDQHDLRLLLTLWPHSGVVDLTLVARQSQHILLDFTVAVRGRIRFNNDKRGQYLEFADCVLVGRVTSSAEQYEAAFSPNTFGRPMLVAIHLYLGVLFE
ncbi:hypothetical protein [Hymenobacter sp. APR13]|uniref:hypothetical protein n=1 Tax=Hymenobacter sp. APR13 TaxID=1356852 RepID=UPI0004E03135|nr:hypothetical protein [Hymenobacter sp. APR13]AII52621.1 hypothetical protein N008_11635 [Hymenobacter sp. APR13]